jgi:hypothetical protein
VRGFVVSIDDVRIAIGTFTDFGDRSSHQKLSLLNWQKQINEPNPHDKKWRNLMTWRNFA